MHRQLILIERDVNVCLLTMDFLAAFPRGSHCRADHCRRFGNSPKQLNHTGPCQNHHRHEKQQNNHNFTADCTQAQHHRVADQPPKNPAPRRAEPSI